MTIARHVRVTGLVQGVFFRAWTCEEAEGLGVSGWVRNRADGSVEAHLEGEGDAVMRLIARQHDVPPQAQVDRVDVREVDAEGLRDFRIRH